ncbi:hypothetical protein HII28_13520 [Planctomonas sp. JC2975]|uniref:hypothetical protein n=1 Tax=Planctomonas sp. JC2975 TaxID=2729626 RepID=UPI0014728C7D|nr:hypothetical protein [Planctomonas sp. JC2975]NNC12891.1 hypothetical protein [Planctomonas sp. JC2975]
MTDMQGNTFSRRNIVLYMANKDGGAHLDDRLPTDYEALTRRNSMGFVTHDQGWTFSREVSESPAPAVVRQVAEELRMTLRLQIPDMLGDLITAPDPAPPRPQPVAF